MTRRNAQRRANRAESRDIAVETGAAAPLPQTQSELTHLAALVKRLGDAFGPAGSEEPVKQVVRALIHGLVDDLHEDALGNLIALRAGSGRDRRKLMFAAHLDQVGILVNHIDAKGFVRFGILGDIKPWSLLGHRCQFENGTIGVIEKEDSGGARELKGVDQLFIDVGADSPDQAPVRVGDAACLVSEFAVRGSQLIGRALDNRVGCAVLIETLRRIETSHFDVYCAFTVQSQVGARGAETAAFGIQPDIAFVVDVAPALDTPGRRASQLELGKGPAVVVLEAGAISSREARERLARAARASRVAYQLAVAPTESTDLRAIQAARDGVTTGGLGIPLRHVNTPSQVVDLRDVEAAIQILTSLLEQE